MIPKKRIIPKKYFHKKFWLSGVVQINVNSPNTPLIKSNTDTKLEKDNVKIKLHRNTISKASDMYELKMAPFDNDDMKGFLLFNIIIKRCLKHKEILRKIRKSSIYVCWYMDKHDVNLKPYIGKIGNYTNTHLKTNLLGLGTYIFQPMLCQGKNV